MADHVVGREVVAGLQPGDQAQAGGDLPWPGEDLGDRLRRPRARRLHELDAHGAPVEAHRVPAAHVERHLLVDGAVLVDHEVGRDAGQLAQSGGVGGEDGVRRGVGRGRRIVQHDQPGMQHPGVLPVVALAEGGHLRLALRAVGHEVAHDRWARRSPCRRCRPASSPGSARSFGAGCPTARSPGHSPGHSPRRPRPAAPASPRPTASGRGRPSATAAVTAAATTNASSTTTTSAKMRRRRERRRDSSRRSMRAPGSPGRRSPPKKSLTSAATLSPLAVVGPALHGTRQRRRPHAPQRARVASTTLPIRRRRRAGSRRPACRRCRPTGAGSGVRAGALHQGSRRRCRTVWWRSPPPWAGPWRSRA